MLFPQHFSATGATKIRILLAVYPCQFLPHQWRPNNQWRPNIMPSQMNGSGLPYAKMNQECIHQAMLLYARSEMGYKNVVLK